MAYITLRAEDILQNGDEYCMGDKWKEIPSFMVGDKILNPPKAQWRRLILDDKSAEKKKSWFKL